jgi:adenine-specific DNA methylase
MTHHLQGGVPNHGFTHWWTMFNPRQLLVHAQLLKAIVWS